MDLRAFQTVQRRHNAPTPVHLQIPTGPTFPFSSPILEEVVTPYPDSDSPERHIKNPFRSSDDSLTSTTNKSLGQDKCDDQRTGWNSSLEQGDVSHDAHTAPSKKARPGLNLVTSFTTNGLRQTADGNGKSPAKGFLDLNDLRGLSKSKSSDVHREDGNQRTWKSKAKGYQELRDEAYGARQAGRSEKQSLIRMVSRKAKQKVAKQIQDLSPSDRPILIGLSIPANQPVETEPSIQKAQQTPVTPSIVIIPAVEDRDWDSSWENPKTQKARPPSSVYSQPTPFIKPARVESIPPVPAIPALNKLPNNEKYDEFLVEKSPQRSRKRRSYSAGTDFDEEFSPSWRSTRGRSLSNDSKLVISKRLSLETISNQRRSQGWWNVLLSPLLARSSTVSTRCGAVAEDSSPPPVPAMMLNPNTPHFGSVFNEKQWESGVSAFSPETPEDRNGNKTQSGITAWPDIDDWDKERQDRTMTGGFAHSPNRPIHSGNRTSPLSASSTQSIPFVMSTTVSQGSIPHNMSCQHDLLSDQPCSLCIGRSNVDRFLAETAANTRGVSPESPGHFTFLQSQPSQQGSDNPFFQRFVANLRNEEARRSRSDSGSTTIEDDEPDFSPHIRKATATPLYRAGGATPALIQPSVQAPVSRSESNRRADNLSTSLGARKISNSTWVSHERASDSIPPPYSSPAPSKQVPRYRAILPPGQQPHSPGPISPEGNSVTAVRGGIQMSGVGNIRPPPATYYPIHSDFDSNKRLPPRPFGAPVTLDSIDGPAVVRANLEAKRKRREKEDAVGKRVGGLWRGRGCLNDRGCFGRSGREGRKRRRWWFAIVIFLLLLVIASVVIAVTLTRKRGDPPEIQSRWLNLTGYPPMPTGISTIGGPDSVDSNPQCIYPPAVWSCALPWEDRENQQYDGDMPNFKFQITFKNGTYPHSTAVEAKAKRAVGPDLGLVSQLLSRHLLHSRNQDFTPVPAPPNLEDIEFLSNTTDGVSPPFIGEETPFFATFLSMANLKDHRKRHSRRAPTFPNLTDIIPRPKSAPDGTAPPANLYPLPINQPLRLFDRGLPTERYGFYTYFDRSIFLKPITPSNDSSNADKDGGVPKSYARLRCTWSQTRFLVQIWTQPEKGKMNLVRGFGDSPNEPSPTSTPDFSSDFSRPGTFPYPVTIKVDRHGGDAKKKMVYCYLLNEQSQIDLNMRQLLDERRDRGGTLINPADGIFNFTRPDKKSDKRDDSWQPIDGGTSGCSCEWRNFHRS